MVFCTFMALGLPHCTVVSGLCQPPQMSILEGRHRPCLPVAAPAVLRASSPMLGRGEASQDCFNEGRRTVKK